MRVGFCNMPSVSYTADKFALHSHKDLGILIDPKLSFNNHIDQVVFKAKQRSCLISSFFLSKDCNILCKAFVTYVRPLLEYCSSVWSPCTVTGVNKIESVQRQFTKKLPGLWDLSYDHRLSVLGFRKTWT